MNNLMEAADRIEEVVEKVNILPKTGKHNYLKKLHATKISLRTQYYPLSQMNN